MTFGRIWLALNGLVFALYGLACLFSPSLPAGYAGIELPTASARNEVAAMYGGLQAGLGGLLVWSAASTDRVAGGLRVMAVLLGSLALGRAVGMTMDGATEYNVGALVYETTAAVLALLGLRLIGERRAVTA